MLSSSLSKFFSKYQPSFLKSFFSVLEGMLHSGSSNTAAIARAMSRLNGKQFNTNDKLVSYLLNNDKMQIDDAFWRCHLNMTFSMLEEQKSIKKGDKIYIQVDFTSNTDDFLILPASIIHQGRAIPIYFTMRNYPKKKGMYDHKKMEQAFIKGLKHVLSKKYQYVIVADRGFGNNRFMQYCEDAGFEYLVRLQPNMSVKHGKNKGILKKIITENGKSTVQVKKWKKDLDIFRNEKEGGIWYLCSNIKELDHEKAVEIYKDRFKIEKCFQDLKSSGFDIESSKIRKYNRFKRLLALSVISQALMVIVGGFIDKHRSTLKKRFPTHISVISAFLHSQNTHLWDYSREQ